MKSMIYVPIFFLTLLLALMIYDGVNALNLRKDLLLKEDRIHFNNITMKAATTRYPLKIDSFHYVIFSQAQDHDERLKMLNDMDSRIDVFAKDSPSTK